MTLTPEMLFRALAAHAAIVRPRPGSDLFRDYDDDPEPGDSQYQARRE